MNPLLDAATDFEHLPPRTHVVVSTREDPNGAIRRRDVRRHRAWMIRAYALALGAGTQVLTLAAGEIIAGPPGEISRALLMGAAWTINLAVAEWAISRRPAPAARTASAVVSHLQ